MFLVCPVHPVSIGREPGKCTHVSNATGRTGSLRPKHLGAKHSVPVCLLTHRVEMTGAWEGGVPDEDMGRTHGPCPSRFFPVHAL